MWNCCVSLRHLGGKTGNKTTGLPHASASSKPKWLLMTYLCSRYNKTTQNVPNLVVNFGEEAGLVLLTWWGTIRGQVCYCDNRDCSNSSTKHTHILNCSDSAQQEYVWLNWAQFYIGKKRRHEEPVSSAGPFLFQYFFLLLLFPWFGENFFDWSLIIHYIS